ncbi:hypothetical protein N9L92_05120 [Saprospiraceae bacterium]|nr:hypothetical protein [Saprospiraceae bacterium]
MTTRAKLLAKIKLIKDDDQLEAILSYLEASEKDIIELSDTDKQSIQISNNQIANGNIMTQQDLDVKVNQWLAK